MSTSGNDEMTGTPFIEKESGASSAVETIVMQPQKPSKDELFRKKQEEMSDSELAELAREEVSKLCKTGGRRSLTMTVPPRVEDTDMLLCELIRRFKKLSGMA